MATTDDSRAHLLKLAKSFSTAMLVTHNPDHALAARPMHIARVDDNGDVYFATDLKSPKVAEMSAKPELLLTMQNSSQFVTLQGTGRVQTDRALIEQLWSEPMTVWFPGGKDDPQLCFICLRVTAGEYWDNAGSNGVKYLYNAAKAYATGETPKVDESQHDKVKV
jgi:general stress protein 26